MSKLSFFVLFIFKQISLWEHYVTLSFHLTIASLHLGRDDSKSWRLLSIWLSCSVITHQLPSSFFICDMFHSDLPALNKFPVFLLLFEMYCWQKIQNKDRFPKIMEVDETQPYISPLPLCGLEGRGLNVSFVPFSFVHILCYWCSLFTLVQGVLNIYIFFRNEMH